MLTICPECGREISDRARECPQCGFPLKRERPYRPKQSKRRLPNGFGRITEVKGRNLREPFRVMVSVGKDENGRPIGKLLKPKAYFKTYNEAYMALTEYNKSPYDLDSDITVADLYSKWSEQYFEKLNSDSSARTIKAAWNYCQNIRDMRVKEVRPRHLKGCIEHAEFNGKEATEKTKRRIKSLFNLMFDYAVEYELVDKNYARSFNITETEPEKSHIAYADWEIKRLWENISNPIAAFTVVQCYSGWRPQELCLMKISDVNLNEMVFKGGMKTDAGKNRVVPIHSCIQELVSNQYQKAVEHGSKTLFFKEDGDFTYNVLRHKYNQMKTALELNPEHRPHDGRKYFITAAKNANVNEYAIKLIVGHAISDVTEKVYTERNITWLRAEIEKIEVY